MNSEKPRNTSGSGGGRGAWLSRIGAGVSVAFFLLPPPGRAALPENNQITVEIVASKVALRVTETTDLRTVLEAVCQRTASQCEIASSAAEVTVFPVAKSGTLTEIVDKLLEGTKLNYMVIAPGPGHAGQLLVEARPPAQDASLEDRGVGPAGTTSHGLSNAGGNHDVREPTPEEHPSPDGTSAPPAGNEGPAGLGGSDAQTLRSISNDEPKPDLEQVRKTEASLQMMYGGAPATQPPQSAGPLPDIAILPFSDSNGNPITVRITNEPITVLPFPGPDGKPIFVQPGPPGQKLEYPIPPSPQQWH